MVILCTALCSCNAPSAGQTLVSNDLVDTNTPYVKWEGRYDTETSEEGGVKVNLYHTATGFTVDFVGSKLIVTFESEIKNDSQDRYPYYAVALDSEVLPNPNNERTFYLTGGKQEIEIVSGLAYGYHTVKCLKMSEPYDAKTSVLALETDGNFVKRDKDNDQGALRFLMVCASGGSGHGSLGFSDDGKGSMGRNTKNSSSLHSFNYLTARMFGADVQFVANSGWGVYYGRSQSIFDVLDYSGITTSNNVSGAKTTAKWDYQQWIPDVIIFNIGGNDTTNGSFNRTTYQAKVVEMVNKLHGEYPNAYMVWTHTNSNAGNYAVASMSDAGIMSAGYMKEVIIPKVGADGTVGANGHNSFYTHVQTADIIANAISEWGFTKLYENVVFEDYISSLYKF